MTRRCAGCNASLEGRHSNVKWCGKPGCKKRVQRRGQTPSVQVQSSAATRAAVLAELEKAGVASSAFGVMALALAGQVDQASGASAATLVKELRATLAEAVALASAKADPLDELGARRAARRAG